ncbi:MAG: NnrU family protein [Gammaproteobacteria bacterium]|nr:NnrU family protein [Gammaproteobacteria bacterium]
MIILVIGLLLFVGIHLLREFRLRDTAIGRLGNGPYRLVYSLTALTGLGLIIWGKSISPFVMVYQPIYEMRGITHFAMLPAFILVAAGNLPVSHLRRHLAHPMLLGTIVWGASHLWANGDLASIILFGTILSWAIIKFGTLVVAKPMSDNPASVIWDIVAVIVGFCIWALILIYHGQLFGIGLTLG